LAAENVVQRILSSIERLAFFPRRGRTGVEPGTRELPVRGLPYILVYKVDDDAGQVAIIAIFHGAMDRT
jgi:toxin ParE1/3/4